MTRIFDGLVNQHMRLSWPILTSGDSAPTETRQRRQPLRTQPPRRTCVLPSGLALVGAEGDEDSFGTTCWIDEPHGHLRAGRL
jgi:hypothetical protein